ncbi:NERD domain-containing protein, partial [Escherichia coli]|nr:NERD domain-containing protein [Escherichia coli]
TLYYFIVLTLNRVFGQFDNKDIDNVFQDYNFNKKELIEVFASISLFAEAHFDSKAAPFNMDINFHSSSFKRIDFCQTLSHA